MTANHQFVMLLAGSLLISPLVAGEVYKWEEDGRVHYGDRPGSADAWTLELQTAPALEPALEDRQRIRNRVLEQFSDERDAQRQEAAELAEAAQLRRENCQQARDHLWRYTHSSYLYEQDEAGNRRILEDSERRAAEDRARAAVEKFCK